MRGRTPGAAASPWPTDTALVQFCQFCFSSLPLNVVKPQVWPPCQSLPSLPEECLPSSPSEGLMRAGFPPGGALESANINVSVAIFSRVPSGSETVTGHADVLILRVAAYVFAGKMLL